MATCNISFITHFRILGYDTQKWYLTGLYGSHTEEQNAKEYNKVLLYCKRNVLKKGNTGLQQSLK